MRTIEQYVVLGEDNEPLCVSDCNSQVEAGEFDGWCLFETEKQARDTFEETCGLDGCRIVRATLTIHD